MNPSPTESPTHSAGQPFNWPKFLDRFEAAALVLLFSWLIYREVLNHWDRPYMLPVSPALYSEGLILCFVLLRRPTQNVSFRWGDWFLAFGASLFPMLYSAISADKPVYLGSMPLQATLLFQGSLTLAAVAIGLWASGFIIQLWAKITLGRNFGVVPANRGVVIYGPYRYMRHPMYFGYLLNHIGLFMLRPTDFNLAIYVIAWSMQITRLLAEERLLSNDSKYTAYCEQVRYRLIPGVF